MAEHTELLRRLIALTDMTGYPLMQFNGQRTFGPPPDWVGPPPEKGSEVFVGKLPRNMFEDQLVPIFWNGGKIYEMRLMLDYSGFTRGYAFVTYTSRNEACRAVRELNGYKTRQGWSLLVVISVDNRRLYVGSIPKTKTKKEVYEELSKNVSGIVDVVLYNDYFDRRLNRGYAFVEFYSHTDAAAARKTLVPGCGLKLWDREVKENWAEPEPEIDDEQTTNVKILYVRNFLISTSSATIQAAFEAAIKRKIKFIQRNKDYALIHFYQRDHAELAMKKLQSAEIDGSPVEIRWARQVDRAVYKVLKQQRGNSKYNNFYDLTQYKRHLEMKEYANSPKEYESIRSAYGGSPCGSSTDINMLPQTGGHDSTLAPAKLDALCKTYMWEPPVYEYQKYVDPLGTVVWVGKVELQVGQPFLSEPSCIGPFGTMVCSTMRQAQVEAAENALQVIQSVFLPRMPSCCVGLQYDYMNASLCRQLPVMQRYGEEFEVCYP